MTAAVVGLVARATVKLLRAAIADWEALDIGLGALLVILCWHSKWVMILMMILAAVMGILVR